MRPLYIAVIVVVVAVAAGSVWSVGMSHRAAQNHTADQHSTIDNTARSTNDHQCMDKNLGKKPAGLLAPGNEKEKAVLDQARAHSTTSPSAYLAYTVAGNVSLELRRDGRVIAKETASALEDDETGAVTKDRMLEAPDLAAGDYVLCIKGKPGSAYKVQTYEYKPDGSTTDVVVKGVIDNNGVYERKVHHSK